MGCVSIPEDKLQRLHSVISSALKGKYTDRATLSKLCGMLQWLFKLFPLANLGYVHYTSILTLQELRISVFGRTSGRHLCPASMMLCIW